MGYVTNWVTASVPCIDITDFLPLTASIAAAPTAHSFNVTTNGAIGTVNVYDGEDPGAITPTAGAPVGTTTPYTVNIPAYAAPGVYTVRVEVTVGTTTVGQDFPIEVTA